MKNKKTSSKAFTLIEMLIVIGIIAILTGVMVRMFGTSTESARAALCMTNMRNLAIAALNCANANGSYPAAGGYDYLNAVSDGVFFFETKGWVSWKSSYDAMPNKRSKTRMPGTIVTFDQGTKGELYADNRLAVTNGSIWSAVRDFKSYVCPEHLKACMDENPQKTYLWSYVMNKYFGHFRENFSAGQHKTTGTLQNADRMLLFAEIPAIDYKQQTKITSGSGQIGDPVLNYNNETIGFNHKVGSRYVGHVAFADGHVSKIFYPEGGGLSLREITEKLCEGKELIFEGGQYKEAE